jgi:hypothetical protein
LEDTKTEGSEQDHYEHLTHEEDYLVFEYRTVEFFLNKGKERIQGTILPVTVPAAIWIPLLINCNELNGASAEIVLTNLQVRDIILYSYFFSAISWNRIFLSSPAEATSNWEAGEKLIAVAGAAWTSVKEADTVLALVSHKITDPSSEQQPRIHLRNGENAKLLTAFIVILTQSNHLWSSVGSK